MNERGMTLIELLVGMAVGLVVLGLVSKTFISVIRPQSQQKKIAEANIDKAIGLEVLRKDIEMAGFGLPWDLNGHAYTEAASDSSYTPDPQNFNDVGNPPKAFSFSDNANPTNPSSDVLVIRSSAACMTDPVTQRWGYVVSGGSYQSLSPDSTASGYFGIMDTDKKLIQYTSTSFPDPGAGNVYFAFGLSSGTPRMPFNRVDYHLESKGVPARCCSGTYELYRSEIDQGTGSRDDQPILDCVKDFQVAFGLDTDGDGLVDSWASSVPSSASSVRNQVKQVRVFAAYQEGQFDRGYTHNAGTITLGDNNTGNLSSFILQGDEVHYRWKVLRLVVNPINLIPQQR